MFYDNISQTFCQIRAGFTRLLRFRAGFTRFTGFTRL